MGRASGGSRGPKQSGLESRDYSVTYGALRDYGVETIYVSARHLAARGLATEDLLVETVPLDDAGVTGLLHEHDVILGA